MSGNGVSSMLMRDMMTRDVPFLHPKDKLRHGVELLRGTKLDALPVVDEEGVLIGIFTKANVLDAFLAGAEDFESIEEHFNSQVVTVEVDTPYREVEQRARQTSVGTGVVIDKKGKALGIFTKVDMILALFQEAEKLSAKLNTVYQAMPKNLDNEPADLKKLPVNFKQIITVSPEMRRLKQEAEIAARGNSTILLTGESGTGKELFAEAIHQASLYRTGPCVKVNCAAVPENLLESEFFGYAGGAFTGAQKGGRAGKFAAAHGGTLFLDEIGDMSLHLQGKLLRVLEDRCFEPLGSNESIKVDVRIIAATNQDLIQKVAGGEFRSDLYYRLNVISFNLIPLRERPEDIMLLVDFFLERLNLDFNKGIYGISSEAHKILLSHSWPGNVRELKNVIERAVNFAAGKRLEMGDLPFYLREKRPEPSLNLIRNWDLATAHKRLDKETLEKALYEMKGNKSEAARLLGISRSWLYEKMRKYDIRLPGQ